MYTYLDDSSMNDPFIKRSVLGTANDTDNILYMVYVQDNCYICMQRFQYLAPSFPPPSPAADVCRCDFGAYAATWRHHSKYSILTDDGLFQTTIVIADLYIMHIYLITINISDHFSTYNTHIHRIQ